MLQLNVRGPREPITTLGNVDRILTSVCVEASGPK